MAPLGAPPQTPVIGSPSRAQHVRLPNLIPGSATGHSKYQQLAISIAIADLTRGGGNTDVCPGGKTPRAATVSLPKIAKNSLKGVAILPGLELIPGRDRQTDIELQQIVRA